MLTKTERQKLADEARQLAMRIVEGKVQPFNNGSYACCAIGELAVRAGINSSTDRDGANEMRAAAIENEAFDVLWSHEDNALVSNGLRVSNPDGAVFPLLALATELDGKVI